jgi:hypothetical protein
VVVVVEVEVVDDVEVDDDVVDVPVGGIELEPAGADVEELGTPPAAVVGEVVEDGALDELEVDEEPVELVVDPGSADAAVGLMSSAAATRTTPTTRPGVRRRRRRAMGARRTPTDWPIGGRASSS